MGFSPYLQNKIQEHIHGISTYSPPANRYAALFIGNPLDSGTEVSAGDYARVEITNDNTEWSVTGNEATNDNDIQFTASPANDWTTGTDPEDAITHYVEFDASSSGNMLEIAELTVPLYAVTGGPAVSIAAGSLNKTIEAIDS